MSSAGASRIADRANLGGRQQPAGWGGPSGPDGRSALPSPRRLDLVAQRRFVAAVARREVEWHHLPGAQPVRDLARLPRSQVVLAQRLVAVAVEKDRLDVQEVDAVEQACQLLAVGRREAQVGDVAD